MGEFVNKKGSKVLWCSLRMAMQILNSYFFYKIHVTFLKTTADLQCIIMLFSIVEARKIYDV